MNQYHDLTKDNTDTKNSNFTDIDKYKSVKNKIGVPTYQAHNFYPS